MDTVSLIKYFTDCYKTDNREFSIENFFSSKFENQVLQNLEEELVNGKYPHQYISGKDGETISKNLQLYKRDKELFYCSLFLVGKRKLFNKKHATTIGIISPFKDQVTFIGKTIRKEITLKQLHKHDIRLGTPYSFQGDERDVVLISLAIDDDSHHSALNYLNRADVFNVMLTRARNLQEIFLSASVKELKFDSLLREYLEKSIHHNDEQEGKKNDLDVFANEVCDFLNTIDEEINYHVGYQLSGLIIDILIEKNGNYLGIDLIGYPGDFEPSFSLERYKVLYRVGIQVIPLSYVTWYFDENIKEKLIDRIDNLG